jgi:endonuclease G
MAMPEQVIAATRARFEARRGPRTATEQKIAAAHTPQGSILNVDTPERVALRTRRVLRQPVVVDALEATPGASPGTGSPVRDDLVLERIIGGNNLLGIAFLELGTTVARSVGRVIIRDRVQTRGFGTAVMISPRLALTNNHVLPDEQAARFSRMEFNFQNGVTGLPLTSSQFALEPDAFFQTDQDLDFTVVAIARQSLPDGNTLQLPLSGFGFNRTFKDQGKILLGESINIIQHPEGHEKQIALQQNELIDRFDDFLHYHTDTSPGSSGSPLYNNQWEILGLHHSGVPARNDAGDIMSVDGTVWDASQGELKIQWIANEGIRISSILTWLGNAAAGMNAEQRALLEETLNPPAPPQEKQQALPTQPAPEPAAVPVDGGVSLTIPVQITVRLGAVQQAQAPVTSSPRVNQRYTAVPGIGTTTAEEAVAIDPDYAHRRGYDPEFLGAPVPLPVLTDDQRANASRNRLAAQGQDPTVLDYHHFSLVMHRQRRLALFTVVNIDGRLSQSPTRESDRWFFDPRLDQSEQTSGELYEDNDFDRGHLVRRLDPAWGPDNVARSANDDTFHFTNCSPQHKKFNQGASLWAGLEDFLLGTAKADKLRLTVFTGPVFTAGDPAYQGTQIPLAFWKVPVFQRPGGGLSASAYMISQHQLVQDMLREAFTPATFQVPVRKISELTGLNFTHLQDLDPMNDSLAPLASTREALATPTPAREVHSFDDLRL